MNVWDDIYRTNAWRGVESASGPGSGAIATRAVAAAIVDIVRAVGARSVLDVGCGDGYWMPALPGYVGVDVSRRAIRLARRNHPDRCYELDRGGPLRAADMVIVRDVLQHVPPSEGARLLQRVMRSGSRWLLASTYVGGDLVDIEPGGCYSPDLTAPPFYRPEPDAMVFDGYAYHETDVARDPRKHLALWRLPGS